MRTPCPQSCPCQKHPCTKITFRSLVKTMSGLPGRSLRQTLNLKPNRWARLRTKSSGAVSRLFIARIMRLRASDVFSMRESKCEHSVYHLIIGYDSMEVMRPQIQSTTESPVILCSPAGMGGSDIEPQEGSCSFHCGSDCSEAAVAPLRGFGKLG